MLKERPANILIIRTSAIGDVVMSSHLPDGLRRMYPEARIFWLAEPQVKPLLEQHPAINGVITFPKSRWKDLFRRRKYLALLGELRSFVTALRHEQFDLVLDVQGLLRTRLLAWLTGARERVGFVSREPGGFLMSRLIGKGEDNTLMGSEYYYVLQQLGMSTGQLQQVIHLAPETVAEAAAVLEASGVSGRYVVFAPFTTRPQKHWFDARWIELDRMLINLTGGAVVWLGGPADSKTSHELAAQGGGVSLAGATSLVVSAAIVSNASMLIGVDTGLTHMGSAFGIPTIALFGATCPYTKTASPNTIVLYHTYPCSPCRRSPSCDGRFDCMQAISVAEVMKVATRLLSPEDRQ